MYHIDAHTRKYKLLLYFILHIYTHIGEVIFDSFWHFLPPILERLTPLLEEGEDSQIIPVINMMSLLTCQLIKAILCLLSAHSLNKTPRPTTRSRYHLHLLPNYECCPKLQW